MFITPIEAKVSDIAYFRSKLTPGFHHQNETYAAMVKAVDDNVGRLLKKIDDLKISGNTIIIFLSDNGGFINDYKGKKVTNNYPLRSGKGSLYEGGIRIPTILFNPYKPGRGEKIVTPISTIDFFPTVLEMCGSANNSKIDGRCFLKLLKREADTCLENRALFWHYPHYYLTTTPVSAVREGNWKLMEFLEDGHVELYDLNSDPGEKHNLTNDEPIKSKYLLEKLHNWKDKVDAQGITKNPNFHSKTCKYSVINWENSRFFGILYTLLLDINIVT